MKRRYILVLVSSIVITAVLMAAFLVFIIFFYDKYLEQVIPITILFLVLEAIVGICCTSLLVFSINKDEQVITEQNETNIKLIESVSVANKANAAKSDFLSKISHDIIEVPIENFFKFHSCFSVALEFINKGNHLSIYKSFLVISVLNTHILIA